MAAVYHEILEVLPSYNLPQRSEQSLYFLHRVVVHEAYAQKSSQALDVQLFGEVQGIVVSVPREEAALAKHRCQFHRRVALDSNGGGRAALLGAPRGDDAQYL